MIRAAWIEISGNHRRDEEAEALLAVLPQRGIECHRFTRKQMMRNRVPADPTILVAGTVPTVETTLRKLGCAFGELEYGECLLPFLHRTVWPSTLDAVRVRMETLVPVFVKPRGRAKRFTGFLAESPTDIGRLYGVSKRCPVWLSTPVEWLAEWRAYIVLGEVRGIRLYAGDDVECNLDFPAEVLKVLGDEAPAGFSIDFGLLSDGRWALVECNDGYGLGNYAVEDEVYTDLIVARWTELMQSRAV